MPIKYLIGEWDSQTSDNYDQYTSYLKQLGHEPTRKDRVAAALQTWTGKQAADNGYKYVSTITPSPTLEGDRLTVVFANSRMAAVTNRWKNRTKANR